MNHPIRALDLALLFFLGAAWGSSFMFIKLALVSVPPVTLAAVRVAGAALVLVAVVRLQGHALPPIGQRWSIFLLVGLTGNVIPFALIGWGETHIDSALAAILMASVPLFTVTLAHFFAENDRLSAAKVAGLALGFAGVAILIGPDALAGAGSTVLGALAIVVAASSYALTNVAAHRIRGMPPAVSGACTLCCAALWAVPASFLLEQPGAVSLNGTSVLAVLSLTLISTASGNLVFFWLMSRTGPSFVSFNNYLIPGMGVVFGTVFLHEEIGLRSIAALALILLGVAAITLRRARKAESRS